MWSERFQLFERLSLRFSGHVKMFLSKNWIVSELHMQLSYMTIIILLNKLKKKAPLLDLKSVDPSLVRYIRVITSNASIGFKTSKKFVSIKYSEIQEQTFITVFFKLLIRVQLLNVPLYITDGI